MNRLYSSNFDLYKYLYFAYKRVAERDEIKFLKMNVQAGSRVLDIGANVGFYTLLLSTLVGKTGKVFAFEPESKNFTNLKKLCRNKSNVVLNKYAVGEKSGKINLYLSDNLNVDHCTYKTAEARKIIPIKCVSIDDYLKGQQVDFVKIDTQGFEYNVLKGMENTVKASPKMVIFCEICPWGLKRSGSSVRRLLLLLKKWGFKVRYLDGKTVKTKNNLYKGSNDYGDIVASRF